MRLLARHHLLCLTGLMLALSTGAFAQETQPDYRDDRSTARSVVQSLYNAVERREYLRAWSYFRDEPSRPTLEDFTKGYEDTAHVHVRTEVGMSDGAAGSITYSVPTVVEATSEDGGKRVFAGCYELRLLQPAAQATPPFVPLGIVKGKLQKSNEPFDTATASCPEGGLQ